MTDEITGDMEMAPYIVTVTEEQNEEWHRKNVESAREWLDEIIEENVVRLKKATEELKEAIEWAEEEGVAIGPDEESEAEEQGDS